MRAIAHVAALLVATLAFSAPPPAPPAGPAARRFDELMAALDSHDADRLAAWVRGSFTEDMLRVSPGDSGIEGFLLGQQKAGGFDVHGPLKSADTQVEMLVRSRGGAHRWLRYVLNVEPAAPHRVTGLFVFPAPAEAIPAEGEPLTAEAAIRELDAAASRAGDAGTFSGVVLLARDGNPVLRKAWGEAERSFHAPNRPDTLFGVASLGKMFTAVAIGRLVQDGKLAWDDPVGKYVTDWLPADVAAQVTIRHLLTHTSGLGDFLDQLHHDGAALLLDGVAAHRSLLAGARPAFPPGTQFQYSNAGYLLLGAVVEAMSGRDFYRFVHDEVFAKAGMPRTAYPAFDDVVENRALGYLRPGEGDGDGWRTNSRLQGLRGTPAGGCYSTADELLAFANALVGYKLLDRPTTEALLEPRVKAPWGGEYGFGFDVEKAPGGGTVVGHAGGFPGVGAVLRIYRDSGWTLVVLSNVSTGTGEIAGAWESLLPRIH